VPSPKRMKGTGKVMFLALLPNIQSMLDKGHPYKEIYNIYADRLGFSYVQFTQYVKRYRPQPKPWVKSSQQPQGPLTSTEKKEPLTSKRVSSKAADDDKKFHWNPIPNKEELF